MNCRFHRLTISRALDGNAKLPARTIVHLGRCPECRGFYEAQSRMIHELVESAKTLCQSPSPFLQNRILAEIRREQPSVARTGGAFLLRWAIAATAGLALGTFLWLQSRSPMNPLSPRDSALRAMPATELNALLSLPESAVLRELGRNLNLPLETELQLVVHDAKTAMDYLADSFLPEQLRPVMTDGQPP